MSGMRAFEVWIDNEQVPPVDIAGAELIVEFEQIDVTPMNEPDPTWEHVDAAGHWHGAAVDQRGRVSYPTLATRQLDDDCEACNGSGYECGHNGCSCDKCDTCFGTGMITLPYLACMICEVPIKPPLRTVSERRYEQGRKDWRVEMKVGGETAGRLLHIGVRGHAPSEGESVTVRCRGRRGDSPGPWWFGVAHFTTPSMGVGGPTLGTASSYWAEVVLHGVSDLGQR